MDVLIAVFLFLHVMGAIVAFGPTFVFPIIGAASRREPQHAHFGAVLAEIVEKRLVLPFALLQGVTGVAIILLKGISLTDNRWLGAGIVLYLVAILYSVLVQAPAAVRMVELTATPPGPGGPAPALLATAGRLKRGGMLLTVLLVLIVILMATKPF